MPYREVDQLIGLGTIINTDDGTEVGQRRYRLTIWQEMLDAGHGEQIPGLLQIEGHVDLKEHEGFDLVGKNLILKLENGQVLPFFFRESNGRIAARGQLE